MKLLKQTTYILFSITLLMGCESKNQSTTVIQTGNDAQISTVRINEFVHWYPAIEQAKMRDEWLKKHSPGQWQFTGKVNSDDRTVVTPQADVNYGYTWFNISNEPLVISMPKYDKYYSLSVFDMNHFMEVYVKPEKPVVIRLPHQKSPLIDANEIVLKTYQGVALTRQVIVNNEEEVMELAKEIKLSGGGGQYPFVIPEFTEEEVKAGLKEIKAYMPRIKDGSKLFGSTYEGIGDLDRASGVMIGQLGTQARYANYRLYNKDANNKAIEGTAEYEITVPKEGMIKNKDGYWSLTVYNSEDKYLIPNSKGIYHVSSYDAKTNQDGTVTIRINPNGDGDNAIPTTSKDWYCVLRAYEPIENIQFPELKRL